MVGGTWLQMQKGDPSLQTGGKTGIKELSSADQKPAYCIKEISVSPLGHANMEVTQGGREDWPRPLGASGDINCVWSSTLTGKMTARARHHDKGIHQARIISMNIMSGLVFKPVASAPVSNIVRSWLARTSSARSSDLLPLLRGCWIIGVAIWPSPPMSQEKKYLWRQKPTHQKRTWRNKSGNLLQYSLTFWPE